MTDVQVEDSQSVRELENMKMNDSAAVSAL